MALTTILVNAEGPCEMTRILPISEVKARLPELVTGVEKRDEEVVVTRNGQPAAVLVNYVEYERLKETLDVLSDPELMRQIEESRAFYAAGGKGLSFEDIFGEPLRVNHPSPSPSRKGRGVVTKARKSGR